MMGDTALLVVELIALLFGVSFVLQLVQRRVGPDRMRGWMGGPPVVAALKGIAVGFVTPFCTYSAIPVLLGLRQVGVRAAGYVAFIVAAPILDPVLFGALVLVVGIQAALAYVSVAFVAALGLALLAERLDVDRRLKPIAVDGRASRALVASGAGPAPLPGGPGVAIPRSSVEASAEPWRGWQIESRSAARASLALVRSLTPLLLAGTAIGLAITALVSPDLTLRATDAAGPLAVPIAAALGTPLYFSTELFVPIADSLREAGIGTGPIVALTIAGTGANLPEFVLLGRLARPGLLATFIGYVFAVAMIGGVLTQGLAG